MKIFLIRHGESTSDIDNLFGGWYDDHLTKRGKSQAVKMARKMKDKNLTLIITSPFKRAMETAEILQKEARCPLVIKEKLKERNNYGILTGKNKEWAKKEYPDLVKELNDHQHSIPQSENYNDFKFRVIKTYQEIIRDNKNLENIAIITHGGVIKCLLREVFNNFQEKELKDCDIIEV